MDVGAHIRLAPASRLSQSMAKAQCAIDQRPFAQASAEGEPREAVAGWDDLTMGLRQLLDELPTQDDSDALLAILSICAGPYVSVSVFLSLSVVVFVLKVLCLSHVCPVLVLCMSC